MPIDKVLWDLNSYISQKDAHGNYHPSNEEQRKISAFTKYLGIVIKDQLQMTREEIVKILEGELEIQNRYLTEISQRNFDRTSMQFQSSMFVADIVRYNLGREWEKV